MNYRAEQISDKWNSKHRPWNQNLIPKKLQELSLAGIYHESKVL